MSKEFKTYLIVVVLAFVIAITTLNFFSFYLVSGNSMIPTLENNNYLVVKKSLSKEDKYKYGDIVVFHASIRSKLHDESDLVKRVIGTEGDRIKIMDNKVYVNDKIIDEIYIKEKKTKGDIEITVKENTYFVMGDNRKVSLDSRDQSIGLIEENEILGKVIVKMFPFERIGDEMNEN